MKTETILATVIIPSYKQKHVIFDALESVLRQSVAYFLFDCGTELTFKSDTDFGQFLAQVPVNFLP